MSRHEQLWAPWRLAYISPQDAPREEPGESLPYLPGADAQCFMCRAAVDLDEKATLVVERTGEAIVILNRFPYNNGHLLIAPLRHQGRLDELLDRERADLDRLIAKYVGLLERLMNAEGFNIGLNLGRVAGAGVPGHLHWHVVPRWSGDTNFMPALAGVRVIPQALEALWDLLRSQSGGSTDP
ncbi:MAG TPA: HIT domain-containing protein [Pirellulales bacterium]|nr:HIT domain-containing protein [Pirellulales bacterium]